MRGIPPPPLTIPEWRYGSLLFGRRHCSVGLVASVDSWLLDFPTDRVLGTDVRQANSGAPFFFYLLSSILHQGENESFSQIVEKQH